MLPVSFIRCNNEALKILHLMQTHHEVLQRSENREMTGFSSLISPPILLC